MRDFNINPNIEKKCVSFCEKVFSGEATPISCPAGFFSHSSGGRILHCLNLDASTGSATADNVTEKFFEDYFSKTNKNIFSIVGEKNGTEIIRRAIEKTCDMKSDHIQEYFLMEGLPKNFNPPFIPRLKLATQKEFSELAEMQYAYEQEEVVYKSGQIDRKISSLNLKKNIKNERVYFYRENGEIVSKLNINAKGKHYLQIGGVYTKVEYRKKGLAKQLISEYLGQLKNTGFGVVLFVKKENLAARRLYESLDFKVVGEYEIVYF